MASSNTVGSVQYDASINLASLSDSLKQADKLVEQSYNKQANNAKKASQSISSTSSSDAQERIAMVQKEAQATTQAISNYSPQIQKQFLAVERATNSVQNATIRSTNAIQKYGSDSVQATQATSSLSLAIQNQSQAQQRLDGMLNGSIKSQSSWNSAITKAGVIAGATAAVITSVLNKAISLVTDSIGAAVERVDTLNNAPKVIQNLGFSAEDSASATQKLDKGIRGLPTSLNNATTALLAIASASGKSIGYATDLTLAFNNMALAGGKGPAEANRALTQFTQALGRGKFNMQDFNTLAEVMPAQLNQVAKSLLGADANTRTLGEALSGGQLNIQQFNDEVIRLNKEGGSNFASFEKQAKDATSGIGTGFANMQTAITRGVAKVIESIGSNTISQSAVNIGRIFETSLNAIAVGFGFLKDAIQQVIIYLQPLIDYISSNQKVMDVLKNTAIVLGAILVGGIVAAIVLVVAAVAALSLAIDTLVNVFTFLMETGINAWNGIVNAWNGAGAFFGDVVTNIKNTFTTLIGFFSDLWKNITGIFYNIGTSIGNAIGSAFRGVMNGVIDFVENTVNSIIKSINKIASSIDSALPGDQSGFRVGEVKFPRFYEGGYTGQGNKYEPAGIVHKGEYVIPKENVNQSTGLPKSDAVGNNQNVTVNLSMSGVMTSSKADERMIANRMGKLINETLVAKGAPAIKGI